MTPDSDGPLCVGILGAARIARKNAVAIGHAESRCVVTAVASRTMAKAEVSFVLYKCLFSSSYVCGLLTPSFSQDLAKEYVNKKYSQDVRIFGGTNAYDDLLNSQDVCDAVYIPLPTL